MRISVKVKTKSKQQLIILKNNIYHISLINPAQKNKANNELIKLLSEHFNVPKSHIKIIIGKKNKNKTCSIAE